MLVLIFKRNDFMLSCMYDFFHRLFCIQKGQGFESQVLNLFTSVVWLRQFTHVPLLVVVSLVVLMLFGAFVVQPGLLIYYNLLIFFFLFFFPSSASYDG